MEHAPETTVNPIRVDRGSCSLATRTIRSFYKSCLGFYLLLENSIATIPFLLQFYRGVKEMLAANNLPDMEFPNDVPSSEVFNLIYKPAETTSQAHVTQPQATSDNTRK
ncbi:hypothetical protein Hamer_G010136 [Homarus americanus]|uniref:Uncharacterized protein n=1 Tax=Homarus americanus TaxID=6706 RepID=A0A8J5MYG7_HOMAM|nr:hypothetical protein Hamer_G010136 [Homarus americanus]